MRNSALLLLVLLAGCATKTHHPGEGICTERYTDSVLPPFENHFAKAAAVRAEFRWPVASGRVLTLKVRFFNGDAFQREKVRLYAREWEQASAVLPGTKTHKLRFLFLDDPAPDTDIRIAFVRGGSESLVGIDCRNVLQKDTTTWFGWVDREHSEEEIRSVILHELGHTLGLIHEHQSPGSPIIWDTSAVYAYYKRTQTPPWDSDKVQRNIFYRYSQSEVNWNKFDEHSIMCYEFSSELIKGGGTPWNTDLSVLDKSFIKEIYPVSAPH
jgi:hypothetical protein